MDPFEWLSRIAPWLQPVIVGAVILFFVSGPIPRRAHQELLGSEEDLAVAAGVGVDAASSIDGAGPLPHPDALPEGWAGKRIEELHTLQLPDFVFQLADSLLRPEPEKLPPELRPPWVFRNQWARAISVLLLGFLAAAVTLSAPPGDERKIVLGGAATGDGRGKRLPRAVAWLQRNFLGEPRARNVGALAAALTLMVGSYLTWGMYQVPRLIPGRVLASLACPQEFRHDSAQVEDAVAVLYAAFFATTPDAGTYVPTAGVAERRAAMVQTQLNLPGAYFRGMARVTIWMFVLLLGGQVLLHGASAAASRPKGLMVLLMFGMVLQAVQWLYLVDAHGRLQLASETARVLAARSFKLLAEEIDPGKLRNEEHWKGWPFPYAYSPGADKYVCQGDPPQPIQTRWRGVWPLHEPLPQPRSAAGGTVGAEQCRAVGLERQWTLDWSCTRPFVLVRAGERMGQQLSPGPGG